MTLRQQFAELARSDPLTGLHNRSVLATELPQLVNGAASVAVHAIDLDHFKAANDRFGHPVGDALLKQVATRLKALAGEGDLLVRMGGDEFVLAQQSGDSEALARRIHDTVSSPYCINGHDIVIGASIGVAASPEQGCSAEALLSRADMALYQAKQFRGGYVMASELPPPTETGTTAIAARRQAA